MTSLRSHSLLFNVAVCVAVGGCEPGAPSGARTSTEPDATEVEAFLAAYLSALEERDEGALRGFYVADGRFAWIEDGELRYRSADEIIASLAAFPPDMSVSTQTTNTRVVRAGDSAAYAWAEFSTVLGGAGGGYRFGGMITLVLERDGEGWRIVGGHTSTAGRGRNP